MRPLSNFLPSVRSSPLSVASFSLSLSLSFSLPPVRRIAAPQIFLSFLFLRSKANRPTSSRENRRFSFPGTAAPLPRGYAKQLSWNAVSCSETRVDVMRLTRARILAELLRTCVAATCPCETATPLSSDATPAFLSRASPSSLIAIYFCSPFLFAPSRQHQTSTRGKLIRDTPGVSRVASVFRLRNAPRDTPRPWKVLHVPELHRLRTRSV